MKFAGWILDLYPKDEQMIVWLKLRDGKCVRLVDKWAAKIHVAGKFGDLLNLACQPYVKQCKFVEKFEKPGDQSRSRVLEVQVKSQKEAASIAGKIERYGGYSVSIVQHGRTIYANVSLRKRPVPFGLCGG